MLMKSKVRVGLGLLTRQDGTETLSRNVGKNYHTTPRNTPEDHRFQSKNVPEKSCIIYMNFKKSQYIQSNARIRLFSITSTTRFGPTGNHQFGKKGKLNRQFWMKVEITIAYIYIYRKYTKEWCGFKRHFYWIRTIILCILCIMNIVNIMKQYNKHKNCK
jgi:hypothetical protein